MSISRRGDMARARVSAPNEVGGGRWILWWSAVAAAAGEANISVDRGNLCGVREEGEKIKKEKE